jgi:hypothetical protein
MTVVDLGLIPATAALQICSRYLALDFPDEQQLKLMEQIAYNGRSIQYFLQRVCAQFSLSQQLMKKSLMNACSLNIP